MTQSKRRSMTYAACQQHFQPSSLLLAPRVDVIPKFSDQTLKELKKQTTMRKCEKEHERTIQIHKSTMKKCFFPFCSSNSSARLCFLRWWLRTFQRRSSTKKALSHVHLLPQIFHLLGEDCWQDCRCLIISVPKKNQQKGSNIKVKIDEHGTFKDEFLSTFTKMLIRKNN